MPLSTRMMHTLARLGRPAGRHALRIVLYHHIAEQEDDLTRGLGVTLQPDAFAMHLDHYQHNYNVVDLEAVLAGNLPERPLLITFDDAYRSVVDVAMPMLAKRSMPAVLFANTSPLDNRSLLFDNLLSLIANTHGLNRLMNVLGVDGHEHVGRIITSFIAAMPLSARASLRSSLVEAFQLDERAVLDSARPYIMADDLRVLAEHGFEIGCHTADHVHGRQITLGDVRTQLLEPMMELRTVSGQPCRAFSYPYGGRADVTDLVEGVMRASGCAVTMLVEGRVNMHVDLHEPLERISPRATDERQLAGELEFLPRLRAARDSLGLRRRAA